VFGALLSGFLIKMKIPESLLSGFYEKIGFSESLASYSLIFFEK